MDIVKTDEKNNQILGHNPDLINCTIIFRGSNNRLICEENVKLRNSIIEFGGNNSIVYLSSNRHYYHIKFSIFNNSVFFIDENSYINPGGLNFVVSEEKNIFIGKNNLFSSGIWMRIADPHLLYDLSTLKRINLTKSIYIGDHVWIGQDALILKGTQIGSGSVIAARAVVSNKKIPSNTLWGGVPAKEIQKGIIFDGSSVHLYTEEQTKRSMNYKKDDGIFMKEGQILNFDDIEEKLCSIKDVDEKINFLNTIKNIENHNRFFID